jgi:DNA-binding SARP family transcriptional activator
VEFRILGPLEVIVGGAARELGGPRQRALLGILLTRAGQVVPAEVLVDELWGDEPPETAAGVLQNYISRLRKELGSDVIVTRGVGYTLKLAEYEFDLYRFERLADRGSDALSRGQAREAAAALREALALWRGPALADLADQPFARSTAARLEELRLVALERRIDADLACGRHDELGPELLGLVTEQPLRERFRTQLMLALYRSGRQADALEAYQDARAALVDGLGIEPSRALQRLQAAILRQDPALDLSDRAPGPATQPPQPVRSILIAASDEDRIENLLVLAEPLARRSPHELILARLLTNDAELGPATARLHEWRAVLSERGVVGRVAVFTSSEPGGDLVRLATEQDVDLLLLAAPPALLADGLPTADLAVILAGAPCDVAVRAGQEGSVEGPVLVPFGGVAHDWAAVELGAWLADGLGVALRLVGAAAVPEVGKRDASRLLSHASLVVERALGVASEPLLVPPGEQGLLEASADAGLLVVGLSTRWHREGLGPTRLALAREASSPVVFTRRGLRPGGLTPRTSLTRFTWSIRAAA